jgi:hypothetical protein
MATSAEPEKDVVLQPTVVTHVSGRELRLRAEPQPPPSGRDIGRLLRPVLVILIVLCAAAALVLLVVNWRLTAVDEGRGASARVDGARDVFDRWIRPMIYLVGTAAAILAVAWARSHTARRKPRVRRVLIVAGVVGFAVATVIGALIGGETLNTARRANLAAVASFLLLAASCLVALTELRVSQDEIQAAAVPDSRSSYLPRQ